MATDKFDNSANSQTPAPKHIRKSQPPSIDNVRIPSIEPQPEQVAPASQAASKPKSHLRKDALPAIDEGQAPAAKPELRRGQMQDQAASKPRSHIRKDAVPAVDTQPEPAVESKPAQSRPTSQAASKPRSHLRKDAVPASDADRTAELEPNRKQAQKRDDSRKSSHVRKDQAATVKAEAKQPETEPVKRLEPSRGLVQKRDDSRKSSHVRKDQAATVKAEAKQPESEPVKKLEPNRKQAQKRDESRKSSHVRKGAVLVSGGDKAAAKENEPAKQQLSSQEGVEPKPSRQPGVRSEADRQAKPDSARKTESAAAKPEPKATTPAEPKTVKPAAKAAAPAEPKPAAKPKPEAAAPVEPAAAKPESKPAVPAKSAAAQIGPKSAAKPVPEASAQVQPEAVEQAEPEVVVKPEPGIARKAGPSIASQAEPEVPAAIELEDEYEVNDFITVSRPSSQPHPVRVIRESDPNTSESKAASKKLSELHAAVPKRFKQVSTLRKQSSSDEDELQPEPKVGASKRIKLASALREKVSRDEDELQPEPKAVTPKRTKPEPAPRKQATRSERERESEQQPADTASKSVVARKKLADLHASVPKRLKQVPVPRKQTTTRTAGEPEPESELEPKRSSSAPQRSKRVQPAKRKKSSARSETKSAQDRPAAALKRTKPKAAPAGQSSTRAEGERERKRPVKRTKSTQSKTSQGKAPSGRSASQRSSQGTAAKRKTAGTKRRTPEKRLPPAARQRRKRTIKMAVVVVVVLLAAFCLIDGLSSFGKIHRGVNVGGVDVSNMTVDEAAQVITTSLAPSVDEGDVIIYASDEARQSTDEPYKITFDYEALEQMAQEPPKSDVFSVSPATLNAHIDGQALAQQAYNVGRGGDFLLGRIAANTFGVTVTPTVAVDDASVVALAEILTNSLGTAMVNPNIAFEEGTFITTPGNDGYMVQVDQFTSRLSTAMLSDEKSLVVPMSEVRMQVDDQAAANAAQAAQAAVSQPATLRFESATWDLDSQLLGQMVSTYVKDGNQLVPYVSLEKVQQVIPTLEGLSNIGTPAKDVKFSYDGSELTYTEASNGMVPDYSSITKQLNAIVFGDEELSEQAGEHSDVVTDQQQQQAQTQQADVESRQAVMHLTISYPSRTYADAHAMGLDSSLIVAYTTDFTLANDNKITNIKLMSDILTNTVIAPGETFSINGTAGEANEEKGFTEAGSIVNGAASSEIGGGICQVATTIYNAALEAGYPIVERHNHSTFVSSYPDGMDAAISWPYLDLKFQNDTDNYIMLLMDYNSVGVTCSLWGISPGYTTEFQTTNWYEGEEYSTRTEVDDSLAPGTEYKKAYGADGHVITIQRDTYESDGSLRRTDAFTSVYQAKDEIIVQGPSA